MATTSIRPATKERLRALIAAEGLTRADGGAVQVANGYPARDLEQESIWIGRTAGPVSVRGLKAGRKTRTDDFTVDVWIAAKSPGEDTATDAEARCADLMATVEDVVANDPHLALDGSRLDGLTGGAYVSNIEGPDAEPTQEGWVAMARVQVSCKASLG